MTSNRIKRVGIIGLGSIGRRHARLLRAIDPSFRLEAFRTHRGALLDAVEHVIEVDRRTFFDSVYDVVAIANPSSLHLETLREVVECGITETVLVEKPFCLAEQTAEALRLLESNPRTRVLPGNTLRFHPAVATLKAAMTDAELGTVLECHAHFGTYMPTWHPYEDYRGSYAARRTLGGGVLLTSIHEIDLMHHLFGHGTVAGVFVGQLTLRDTDVEDTAHLLLRLERCPIANVSLNFFERPADRSLKVVFERGVWSWRFAQAETTLTKWRDDRPSQTVHVVDASVDAMYLNMWRAVLDGALADFEMASVFASLKTTCAARAISERNR